MGKPYYKLDPTICDGYQCDNLPIVAVTGAVQPLVSADSARVSLSVSFLALNAAVAPGNLRVGATINGVFTPLVVLCREAPHYQMRLEEFGYLLCGDIAFQSIDTEAFVTATQMVWRG